MWCHQGLYLSCPSFVWISAAAFFSSLRGITVFEGEHVLFPPNVTSELNFMDIEWRFCHHDKSRLLAMLKTIEGNRKYFILDNRFQITENGSLVLKDACFHDAGDYICTVIHKSGDIQKHTINLLVQPHNSSLTSGKNSTSTESSDVKDQTYSLRTAIIACSVAVAVVFLVGILSGIIYRSRKTDEGIYANIPKGQKKDATTLPTARTA